MFSFQRFKESRDGRVVPFHFCNQAGRVIQHIPREVQPLRQIVNEWTESDALYDPSQSDLNALWHHEKLNQPPMNADER